MDADVLVQGDVAQLFCIPWEEDEAIKVVKHPPSHRYEWPSVILFNNERCKILDKDFVENSACNTLAWASGIGELPKEWNYLVGYEKDCGKPDNPQLIHFTQGLPVFEETQDTYKEEFLKVQSHMNSSVSWEAFMGRSVHKKAMGL